MREKIKALAHEFLNARANDYYAEGGKKLVHVSQTIIDFMNWIEQAKLDDEGAGNRKMLEDTLSEVLKDNAYLARRLEDVQIRLDQCQEELDEYRAEVQASHRD